MTLPVDTAVLVLVSGVILLWALVLGVWKFRGMATSPTGHAHPYVDIAHRAALLYSFATMVLAALVHFGAWSTVVNLVASGAVVFFFVAAIVSYVVHGARRDTDNQFVNPVRGTHAFMVALAGVEIVGLGVLIAGFVRAQFL
ncbi:hypothetical protein [Rhodococcoides corynebacterioides]|uniref:hypothetical protein n=1 Tax=Rhodococcoides corynebacterioides TaxID=53972 RepID=UPI000833CE76|nr:hypothetical protein [Rhodococcus corynebacterioides]